MYGVKTAWHGPGDVSPVGHMANVTLDVACHNFGIQEYSPFNDHTQEIFQGCPVMKDGYLWVSEKPDGASKWMRRRLQVPLHRRRNNLNGGWERSGAATARDQAVRTILRRALLYEIHD